MKPARTIRRLLATGNNGEMTWRQRRAVEKRIREEEDRALQEWIDSGGPQQLSAAISEMCRAANESAEGMQRFMGAMHEALERMRRRREVGEV